MLTCAKISVLALSTCFTLAASFRNLAMARGDWVTSPCVLYFSYKDVEDKFQSVHASTAQWGSNFWVCGWKVVLYCGTIYYNAQGGSNSNKSYLKVIMFDFQKWLIGKCGLAAFLILYIYPWISTLKILIKWSLSLMSIAWPPRVRSNLEHGFEIICKYMFTVCDFLHLLDPLVMLITVQSMTYPTPLTATCGAVSVIPLSLCLTVL